MQFVIVIVIYPRCVGTGRPDSRDPYTTGLEINDVFQSCFLLIPHSHTSPKSLSLNQPPFSRLQNSKENDRPRHRKGIAAVAGFGEEILWAARPQTGIKLRTSDAVMIPFSIVWCGFSIFWVVMAYSMDAPIPFVLFGVPFVFIGLYLVFGRFFADANRRAKTIYAFTRERVIIRMGGGNTTVESIPIASLAELTLEQKADGSGTILLRPDISPPGALNYSHKFSSRPRTRKVCETRYPPRND